MAAMESRAEAGRWRFAGPIAGDRAGRGGLPAAGGAAEFASRQDGARALPKEIDLRPVGIDEAVAAALSELRGR